MVSVSALYDPGRGKTFGDLQIQIGTWAKEHGVDFVIMYGQTEATARMSYLPADQCLDKIGSIGIAIPGGRFIWKMRIKQLVSEN